MLVVEDCMIEEVKSFRPVPWQARDHREIVARNKMAPVEPRRVRSGETPLAIMGHMPMLWGEEVFLVCSLHAARYATTLFRTVAIQLELFQESLAAEGCCREVFAHAEVGTKPERLLELLGFEAEETLSLPSGEVATRYRKG